MARLQAVELNQRLKDRSITMELTDAALDFAVARSYDHLYGARPLRRWLEHSIITPLSRMIISGARTLGLSPSLVCGGVREVGSHTTYYPTPAPNPARLAATLSLLQVSYLMTPRSLWTHRREKAASPLWCSPTRQRRPRARQSWRCVLGVCCMVWCGMRFTGGCYDAGAPAACKQAAQQGKAGVFCPSTHRPICAPAIPHPPKQKRKSFKKIRVQEPGEDEEEMDDMED